MWTGGGGTYTMRHYAGDCLDTGYGAACFREAALPIIVHFSDICSHNGPPGDTGCDDYVGITPAPHTWADAIAALNSRGAKYVGINSSSCSASDTTQCTPTQFVTWSCNPSYYAGNDGCDCGCGAVDLDCADAGIGACLYCNNPGSCTLDLADAGVTPGSTLADGGVMPRLCGYINPADNAVSSAAPNVAAKMPTSATARPTLPIAVTTGNGTCERVSTWTPAGRSTSAADAMIARDSRPPSGNPMNTLAFSTARSAVDHCSSTAPDEKKNTS